MDDLTVILLVAGLFVLLDILILYFLGYKIKYKNAVIKTATDLVERDKIVYIDVHDHVKFFIKGNKKSNAKILRKYAEKPECPFEIYGDYLVLKSRSEEILNKIIDIVQKSQKPMSMSELYSELIDLVDKLDLGLFIKNNETNFRRNNIYVFKTILCNQRYINDLYNKLSKEIKNKVVNIYEWLNSEGISEENVPSVADFLMTIYQFTTNKYGDIFSKEIIQKILNVAKAIVTNKEKITLSELVAEIEKNMKLRSIVFDYDEFRKGEFLISNDNTIYSVEYIIKYIDNIFKTTNRYKIPKISEELNVEIYRMINYLTKLIGDKKISARIADDEIVYVPEAALASIRTTPTVPAEPTTVMIPNYEIEGILGSGATATVFKAFNSKGHKVALKIMNIYDNNTKREFQREALIWKHLNHPNIVKILDFSIKPIPYIAMELMDGTLRDILNKQKAIQPSETIKIIRDVLLAIKYAHEKHKIIHRDIKPENILYKENEFKISDWGLAKLQSGTTTTGFKGTIAYSAPEQFNPNIGEISPKTDVWQLGAVFYEMVAGKPPFGTKIGMTINKILHYNPERPENIPDELWNLISRMLEKEPEDRISVNETIEFLNQIK